MALHLRGRKIKVLGDLDKIDITSPEYEMITECSDSGHDRIKEIVSKGRYRIACPECGYAYYIPRGNR